MPDIFGPTATYKGNHDNYWKFNAIVFEIDTLFTTNSCNSGEEKGTWENVGQHIPVKKIGYHATSEKYFYIHIGPDDACESKFYMHPDSFFTYNHLDTLVLNNEIFYDVYNRTPFSGNCCSEIYYNEKYGVVGFNWMNEWYALETDSLNYPY